jgi:HK97 gp10 family phage protein
MSFSIEFMGLDEFRARMAKGELVVKEEMLRGIDRMTLKGQSLSQGKVGVRTGTLRRSIAYKKATWAGGGATGSWGTNVTYAKFHEFGTRYQTGRFYLRDAGKELTPEVQAEFRAVALRIIARMGGG